jgi:hypothetical protein
MLTLIGSTAAKHWFEDFRTPKDTDYHSDQHLTWTEKVTFDGDVFVDHRLGAWDWGKPAGPLRVATPEELYTMKVSHAFWEINHDVYNWNKHMSDVIFFQRKDVKFIRELYDILLPIWKELHAPKRTSLSQNKENFFKDAVDRIYDHDSIHASIAYGDHPLYEDILVPGEEVAVDSSKFFNDMDYETQLKCVREEVYATALERILIPNEYKGSPGAAYAWALRRTITSLFKGEWALWAVLNYDTLARPDCDYRQRHLDNIDKLIRLENEE